MFPTGILFRRTFLVLFSLIAFLSYLVFVAPPSSSFALSFLADSDQPSPIPLANDLLRSRFFLFPPSQHRPAPFKYRPQIQLNQSQELAAVASFLASLPQNIIPSSVDPSQPIDPQLVLDFDTRSPRAVDEVRQIVEDVWTRNPVILFSQLYSSRSRKVKAMIADMNLSPPPTVFDIDQRHDANVLTPLLLRLTSSAELPILLVGGNPIGTTSQISSLFQTHDLHGLVRDAGAIIDNAPTKRM